MSAWFDLAGRTPLAGNGVLRRLACHRPELHVWAVEPHAACTLRAWIADSERTQAERMLHAERRRMFIAARGALRMLLGHYLGCDALSLSITRGPHGKPSLIAPAGAARLAFNVSHCEDRALIALGVAGGVGVDIERADRKVDAALLARRCLSTAEQRRLEARPGAQRAARFLRYWTHKEAVAKALGAGLTLDFRTIEIDLDAPEQHVVVCDRTGRAEVEVFEVAVGASHHAAAAVCIQSDLDPAAAGTAS